MFLAKLLTLFALIDYIDITFFREKILLGISYQNCNWNLLIWYKNHHTSNPVKGKLQDKKPCFVCMHQQFF
jgi:hypothetical protein